MSESKITYNQDGSALSFEGPEAVAVFQAAALMTGIRLMSKGIRPHRSWTSMKVALAQATRYTGQTYRYVGSAEAKRDEVNRACGDLRTWIETMKSALPTEVRS